MDAEVTIKFQFNSVCSKRDLEDTGMSFEEMVKYLLEEEGILGCCEDKYEVLEVKEK